MHCSTFIVTDKREGEGEGEVEEDGEVQGDGEGEGEGEGADIGRQRRVDRNDDDV